MGTNIHLLRRGDPQDHPEWDPHGYAGSREFGNRLFDLELLHCPMWNESEEYDDHLYRPRKMEELVRMIELLNLPNPEIWLKLVRILRENPDYWIRVSM